MTTAFHRRDNRHQCGVWVIVCGGGLEYSFAVCAMALNGGQRKHVVHPTGLEGLKVIYLCLSSFNPCLSVLLFLIQMHTDLYTD